MRAVREEGEMDLLFLITAWHDSIERTRALGLDDANGAAETSLPGWRVRDVLAHLVHFEECLAFGGGEQAAPSGPGITPDFTQLGVDALAEVPVAQLSDRLEAAAGTSLGRLTPPPTDPEAGIGRALAGREWAWGPLLRNRAIDAWMHEQDIRRAIDRPGGLDSAGARISVAMFADTLPYVVGKLAAAPQAHPVRFEIVGPAPFIGTIAVGPDGRAATSPAEPLTTITMDTEAFTRLCGGREPRSRFDIAITGDAEVADRILAHLAVTP